MWALRGPVDSVTVLRIVTWNVNSLKARLPRVEQWLAENGPEVVCLQETKMKDEAFPGEVFEALGYESAHHGQGQWNGVAILSKVGLTDVVAGWDDDGPEDGDARIIWATCGDVRVSSVYVPNGRSLDDPHYTYKLGWLERLRATLERREDRASDLAVCGDFNICPDDRDVWSPEAWIGNTHVSEHCALSRGGDSRMSSGVITTKAGCIRSGTTGVATSIRDGACASTSSWPRPRSRRDRPGPVSIGMRARVRSRAIMRP